MPNVKLAAVPIAVPAAFVNDNEPAQDAAVPALEAVEESPLAVAARTASLREGPAPSRRGGRVFSMVGVTALLLGFLGSTVWIRASAPARVRPQTAPAPGIPAFETEVDRLVARAAERIDARDDTGAEEAAMRAAAVDPSDARAHLLLGRVHLRRGRVEAARSSLNRVVALEPVGPRADEARALLSTMQ